jgi:hypothetical protein
MIFYFIELFTIVYISLLIIIAWVVVLGLSLVFGAFGVYRMKNFLLILSAIFGIIHIGFYLMITFALSPMTDLGILLISVVPFLLMYSTYQNKKNELL